MRFYARPIMPIKGISPCRVPVRKKDDYPRGTLPKTSGITVRSYDQPAQKEYLLVDGYNIIFAWQELKELAAVNIDSARGRLLDILCNYQGSRQCELIVVFDAYRVKGHVTEFMELLQYSCGLHKRS